MRGRKILQAVGNSTAKAARAEMPKRKAMWGHIQAAWGNSAEQSLKADRKVHIPFQKATQNARVSFGKFFSSALQVYMGTVLG